MDHQATAFEPEFLSPPRDLDTLRAREPPREIGPLGLAQAVADSVEGQGPELVNASLYGEVPVPRLPTDPKPSTDAGSSGNRNPAMFLAYHPGTPNNRASSTGMARPSSMTASSCQQVCALPPTSGFPENSGPTGAG
jgi:hypothetical protein